MIVYLPLPVAVLHRLGLLSIFVYAELSEGQGSRKRWTAETLFTSSQRIHKKYAVFFSMAGEHRLSVIISLPVSFEVLSA